MIWWWLVGLALGAEPPERPHLVAAMEGECQSYVGADEGQPMPEEIVDGATARCSFVAAPPSEVGNLLALETHLEFLEARYRIDTAALEGEITRLAAELDGSPGAPGAKLDTNVIVIAIVTGMASATAAAYVINHRVGE